MAKRVLSILAVGLFVGVLAGAAAADYLGVAPQNQDELSAVSSASSSAEYVPEGNWSGTDWQNSGAIETGAMPSSGHEESWMREYGHD